jgi:predicted O-linked N-acetylglucosamine transferase (SPINDLY family)
VTQATKIQIEPQAPERLSAASPVLEQARRAMAAGDATTAEALYRLCVTVDPHAAEAHRDLGMLGLARGASADALAWLDAASRLAPDDAETQVRRCGLLLGLGRVAEAVLAGRRATALGPHLASAHLNLAGALEARDDIEGALDGYRRALALAPGDAVACLKLANLLRAEGRFDEALPVADAAVALDPRHYGARIIRGLIRDALGDRIPAGEDLAAAAALSPPTVAAQVSLALIAIGQRREALAEEVLGRALACAPRNGDLLSVLGALRQGQGRPADALAAFETAIGVDPTCVRAHYQLGGLLLQAGRLEEAAAACRTAIRLAPGQDEAWLNLGAVLRLQGRLTEAIAAYAEILGRHPAHGEALVNLCALRRRVCDWQDLEALEAASLERSLRIGRRVPPFTLFAATGSPGEHRRCARLWAAGLGRSEPPLAAYAPRRGEARLRPLRIGYLSGDFHDHATAMLIAELLELHDRSRVETFGYGYDVDDGSPMRRRLVAALDHFADVRPATHLDAARRIRRDEIDVLIDLKGYLHEARTEIMALRPAPIQVNFLGYPGTMGAGFIDYVIADAVVAPPGSEPLFDEKIVRLPHCYQPNDRRRPLPDPGLTRDRCGLPAEGVVLCCLNASYKIRPEIFAVWMRLLAGAPGTVLWLLEDNGWMAENLRREAAARGVDPARLVFAPRVPPAEHLARLGLGDLFLDTSPVNAHTTASEALWAGMPVLTCMGEAFVSRVAASLDHAAGLPELVTASLDAYEALGLSLARDPARLAALRRRLEAGRAVAPLFDTPRYVRHFEAALIRMGELRDAGLPPRSFSIEA